MNSSGNDFIIGFLIGFFLGCFGIVVAAFLKADYLQGAIAGVVSSVALGCLAGGLLGVAMPFAVALDGAGPGGGMGTDIDSLESIDFGGASEPAQIPWDLVFAVLVGSVIAAGGVGGALWMASNGEEDGLDHDDHLGGPGAR